MIHQHNEHLKVKCYVHYGILRSIFGTLEMIGLCFSIQEGDVIEHTNGKCRVLPLLVNW